MSLAHLLLPTPVLSSRTSPDVCACQDARPASSLRKIMDVKRNSRGSLDSLAAASPPVVIASNERDEYGEQEAVQVGRNAGGCTCLRFSVQAVPVGAGCLNGVHWAGSRKGAQTASGVSPRQYQHVQTRRRQRRW